VRSFRDSSGFTLAVAVERREEPATDEAEVIDLVQLPPGTRPTPFASIEYEEVNRCRVLDCGAYATCLNFAARLQWPSFHCRQCPRYTFDSRELELARARERAGAPDARIIKLR
jgi:hypothetical protein